MIFLKFYESSKQLFLETPASAWFWLILWAITPVHLLRSYHSLWALSVGWEIIPHLFLAVVLYMASQVPNPLFTFKIFFLIQTHILINLCIFPILILFSECIFSFTLYHWMEAFQETKNKRGCSKLEFVMFHKKRIY